jgi:hypothetical protein
LRYKVLVDLWTKVYIWIVMNTCLVLIPKLIFINWWIFEKSWVSYSNENSILRKNIFWRRKENINWWPPCCWAQLGPYGFSFMFYKIYGCNQGGFYELNKSFESCYLNVKIMNYSIVTLIHMECDTNQMYFFDPLALVTTVYFLQKLWLLDWFVKIKLLLWNVISFSKRGNCTWGTSWHS